MKLNKNKTNIIILLILISFINSEPTKFTYGRFSKIKHKKITLKLNDELTICKDSEQIPNVWMRMFDHDKILKSINGDDSACEYYKAVKTGKFEIIFDKKVSFFDSIPYILKEAAYGMFLLNYKKWDVVVSE